MSEFDEMTVRGRTLRFPPHHRTLRVAWGIALCVAAMLSGAGCKNSGGGGLFRGGGGGGEGLARGGDPLLGARIPPQNLPIPGRGEAYGSRGGAKDPLFAVPTTSGGDDRATKATQKDKEKNPKEPGDSASLPRRRPGEPWRPGLDSSNAALAGGIQPDDSVLSMGERPNAVVPASIPNGRGPVKLQPRGETTSSNGSAANADTFLNELRQLGVKWEQPVREGNQFVVRADVPVSENSPGLVRRYEGAGSTPAAAAKQLLDQIKSDRVK